jgi:hypothetical protein
MRRYATILAAVAATAAGSTAWAQAYRLQKTNSINLSTDFFGGGTATYGVNPISVAFDGQTAWVGGYNNQGTTGSIGVVRIGDVLTASPASAGLTGSGATFASSAFRGFQQMDVHDGAVYLAYDNNESITPFIRKIDGTTGDQLWQVDSPALGARPIAMAVDPRGGADDNGTPGVPGLRLMSQDPFVSGGAIFSLRLSDGAVVYGPGSVIEQGGAGVFITAGQRAFGTFSNRNIAFDEAGNFLLSTGVTHGVATRTGDNSFAQYNVAVPDAGSTGVLDKQGAEGQVVVNGDGINSEFMPAIGSTTADFMAVNTRVPDALNNTFNYRSQNGTVQAGLDARDVHLRNLDGTLRPGASSTLTGEEDFLGTRYSGQVKDLATGRDANGNPVLLVLSFADRQLDIYQIEPTWAGGAGDWDTASSWQLNLIADGATQNARFDEASAPTTITLNSDKTTKLLKLDSTNAYTIAGSGRLITDAPDGRGAHIAVIQGSHTVAVPVQALKGTDLRIPVGSTLTLAEGITGAGATKRGAGVANVEHVRLSAVNVAEGTLRLIENGTDSASRVGILQIANDGTNFTATLDITDAPLVVDYGDTDPEAEILAAVLSGRAGGTWTGTGLTSSAAAANTSTAVGVVQASELTSIPTVFVGADTTSLLVRQTLRGDNDLTGTVDFSDLLSLAQNYDPAGTGKRWAQGDSDYNQTVDFDDLLALAQNYGTSAIRGSIVTDSTLHQAFASHWALARSVVPEPATLAVLGSGVLLLLRRR